MAGNATVTLYDGTQSITFEIWMQQFATASLTEFNSGQTRNGISWMPIRRGETSVAFSAVWPLVANSTSTDMGFENFDPKDGFGKMQYFQDTLRKHQQALVQGGTNTPMVLNYYNNSDTTSPIYNTLISENPLPSLQYSGWIQSVEKNYIRFQNVYMTNYNMVVINPNTSSLSAQNTPSYQNSSTTVNTAVTYAPTVATQNAYGSDWININTLVSGANYIQGLPS
jgi:hypothetical protein